MQYIYVNNDNLQYWLQQAPSPDSVIVTNFEEWCSKPGHECVALWETQDFQLENQQIVETLCKHARQVVLFLPEFISDQWCHMFDLNNVVFFIAGFLNWQPEHAKIKQHYYFFWSTTDFYHTHPEVLDQVNSTLPKPKAFDVLLGRQKPHRAMLHLGVDSTQNIVTYFPSTQDQDLRHQDSTYFQWPAELIAQPAESICWTGNEVLYNNTIVSLSQLIPVGIYNATAYTLVAETQYENSFSFFTEKIIKPLMCERVFIVCSGQYYLKNLRQLGFRTFDGIIDESYDVEPNLEKRVSMILAQINLLAAQDQQEIYSKSRDILTHNKNLVMNSNWLEIMVKDLINLL